MKSWYDSSIAILDVETTGFDPRRDRIVEIAVVIGRSGNVLEIHDWLVDPRMPIPFDASRVHGITDEDVIGAPTIEKVMRQVWRTVSKVDLVGAYNARFDYSFIHANNFHGAPGKRPSPLQGPWLDPLLWIRRLDRRRNANSLEEACYRHGIELETAHRAWADAKATLELWYALADEYPDIPEDMQRMLVAQSKFRKN